MAAADDQLETFIARFTPEVAAVARTVLKKLARRLPAANRIVYDNYNALAIGFCVGEKQAGVILSVALYPRWTSLFFFGGPHLPDPEKRLKGSGSKVRHIVLKSAADLDEPAVSALIDAAIARADPPLPKSGKGVTIIKSISANQRPRRP
ncbi:MAG: hypothetical protein GC155_00835 [Alphaproteobacteria bacterium]|nr:hypothetical protein [Alphaproteobacteria bacterium]